jgi:HSP20 family molecular chaperone IbpA
MIFLAYSMKKVFIGGIGLEQSTDKRWGNLDPFFNNKFFNDANPLEGIDLSSINNYVQNAISHVMPSETTIHPDVHPDIFETHNFVIVKLKLPKNVNPSNIRLFIQANHIKLEGWANEKEQIIKLPSSVQSTKSKALFKQGVLEIKMPKIKFRDRFHEVFIRF